MWGGDAIIFGMQGRGLFFALFLLSGCVSQWRAPYEMIYVPVQTATYEIATWQKMTNSDNPVHIYIEGDGHAFRASGAPTSDPTPRGMFMRDLAASDKSPNVAYVARPCQFIMSSMCAQTDWTDGRFSPQVIDALSATVKTIAKNRPVVLIGYSGGAMATGLIIKNYPEINVVKWITIAGVLNHVEWTNFFGDSPLSSSLNMDELPHVPQRHYAAQNDKVVPISLTRKWAAEKDIVIVPNTTHENMGMWKLDFSY